MPKQSAARPVGHSMCPVAGKFSGQRQPAEKAAAVWCAPCVLRNAGWLERRRRRCFCNAALEDRRLASARSALGVRAQDDRATQVARSLSEQQVDRLRLGTAAFSQAASRIWPRNGSSLNALARPLNRLHNQQMNAPIKNPTKASAPYSATGGVPSPMPQMVNWLHLEASQI